MLNSNCLPASKLNKSFFKKSPLAAGGIVIILVLIFVFSPGHILCFASDAKEIEIRLSGTVGKERLELLSQLINLYQNKEPKKILEYGKDALQLLGTFPDRRLEIAVLNHMSTASLLIGDFRASAEYAGKSHAIAKKIGDRIGEADALHNLGRTYWKMGKSKREPGQYQEARQLLEQALEIARIINIKNEIKSAAKELSEIFEILGDHQKALVYYQEYKNIDEEIFNEISRKKMLEIQTLYETDQREKELTLLKKNRQIQQLELEHQKTFMNSVLFIALLILFLVFVTYTLYRLKTRTTQTLSKEIREHKQTAQKLRESEEKFRTLAEKSVVGISIIQDHVIQYANPAFLTVFGCTFEDIVGQSPLTLVMEEDRALVLERLNQPMSRENAADFTGYEFKGLTKEGKVIYLESYSVKTLYQGQAAIFETIIDITDRKKTGAELLKMRKLESMGTLAESIARDFHHLLSGIASNAEKLKGIMPGDSHLCNWVENIENTSLKATNLAQKLITFSKGGGEERLEVALSSILKSTIDTYPQLQKLIRSVCIPPGLKPIYCDEKELTRVISSLLWNAQEAKNNNEEVAVTITAQNTIIPPVNNVSLKAGEYIEVVVTDNGKGIPDHHLDKVFDPYFSTKEVFTQKGMGLGLAICYSIIKKHNGHISIKSQVGIGTTVELILPVYKSNT
jgi:PAS domain S-box-containing protein